MSETHRPASEQDLHALIDGQLDTTRLAAVERHLTEHPDDAARVEAWRAQRAALRAALASHSGGRTPPRLDPRLILEQQRTERRLYWRAAAAVLLAFGIGAGAGWGLHAIPAPGPSSSQINVLVREAVANHIVYTADRRRPTELGADQRDDLARWVSNRLNRPVAPPDLTDSGYRYMGGRLAATPEGPAGLFMYQNDSGTRLTVFVRPDSKAVDVKLRPVEANALGGAAWIDKGVGYTVVAPISKEELQPLAEQVQRLLAQKT